MSQEETQPNASAPEGGSPPAPDLPPAPEAAPVAPAVPQAGDAQGDAGTVRDDAPADGAATEASTAAPIIAGEDSTPVPEGEGHPEHPHRRRRRRRRRGKGPRPAGEGVASAAPPGETASAMGAGEASGAELGFSEGGRPILSLPEGAPPEAPAPGQGQGQPAVPGEPGEHKRRRRRRRRGKRPPGAPSLEANAAAGEAPGAGIAPEGDAQDGATAHGSAQEGGHPEHPHRRRRRRRDRGEGESAPGGEGRRDQAARQPGDGEERRGRGPRRGREDRGDRGNRGPREGGKRFGNKKPGFGRGRDGGPRKEPPKLYTFESIVDRGFEDVADPANDGATRRVDWQILKRTVADQKSAKPVSAVYLLRREGVDADYANLAAARAAVNKTIVHPEKLTRPKADYPSTKK